MFESSFSGGISLPRERIETSMALVLGHLQRDSETSQFLDALGGQACFTSPTKSGLSEADYLKLPVKEVVQELNRTPLPAELLQLFRQMKCGFQTGLFPDIYRAWASIDSDLIIWNYQNGRDVVYYDDIEHVILAVDFVRPKPNVLHSSIHYLLVVATTVSVVILGLTLAQDTVSGDIELHFDNVPLYSCPLEGVVVSQIKGSRDGRIFLGAQDGSLFELSYFAQRGWLQRSLCKLTNCSSRLPALICNLLSAVFRANDPIIEICIDDFRHILYTLSERGVISVYDLGVNGNDMVYVTSASEEALLSAIPDCDAGQVRRVIHIECLPPFGVPSLTNVRKSDSIGSDSSSVGVRTTALAASVHLVAFTQSGARLYLSTTDGRSAITCDNSLPSDSVVAPVVPDVRPSVLLTLHVRLPLALPHKIAEVSRGLVLGTTGNSVLLLDGEHGDGRYVVISLDHYATTSFRRAGGGHLVETYSLLNVNSGGTSASWGSSGVWALCAADTFGRLKQQRMRAPLAGGGCEPSLDFVMLSLDGCQLLRKLSPTEQLRQLLVDNRGAVHASAIRAFFSYYNFLEGCIMCLQVICFGDTDAQVVRWASDAFNFFGGEPQLEPSSSIPNMFQQASHQSNQQQVPHQQAYGPFRQPFPQLHPQDSSAPVGIGAAMSTPLRGPLFFSDTTSCPVSPIRVTHMHQQHQPQQQHHQQHVDFNMNQATAFSQQYQQPLTGGSLGVLESRTQPQFAQNGGSTHVIGTGVTTSFSALNQVFMHSYKHDAIFLYVARTLRPIIDRSLARLAPPLAGNDDNTGLQPRLLVVLKSNTIMPILSALGAVRDFLHSSLTVGYSDGLRAQQILSATAVAAAAGASDAMLQWKRRAVLEEHSSLAGLKQLIDHAMEALHLWRLVADHGLDVVSLHMKPDLFARLKTITVREYVGAADRSFLSALATALVEMYLRNGAATSVVSEQLTEFCPSIYNSEDAVYTAAYEILTKACSDDNGAPMSERERDQLLSEGLRLCRTISVQSLNLAMVCRLLRSARHYSGLISMCVWAANGLDPHNAAAEFVRQREPADDERGRRALLARRHCYTLVTDLLSELYHNHQEQRDMVDNCQEQQLSSTVVRDSPPLSRNEPRLNPNLLNPEVKPVPDGNTAHIGISVSTGADSHRSGYESVLARCLATDDALFHEHVFDWLVLSGQHERLLHLRSPHLKQYLRRRTECDVGLNGSVSPEFNSLAMRDLRCRYLVLNGEFDEAVIQLLLIATGCQASSPIFTRIYQQMNLSGHSSLQQQLPAILPDVSIPLASRTTYLARALVCARAGGLSTAHLVRPLEELMQVAKIQERVAQQLDELLADQAVASASASNATISDRQALDTRLFSINELYADYAEKYGLAESQLLLLQCAGYTEDIQLIHYLWAKMIEQAASTGSSGWRHHLAATLRNVFPVFVRTPIYFPLEVIVSCAEERFSQCHLQQVGRRQPADTISGWTGCDPTEDALWLAEPLVAAGVRWPTVHFTYHALYLKPELRPLRDRLLHVLAAIVARFAEQPELLAGDFREGGTVSGSSFRNVIQRVIANVSTYVLDLQARVDQHPSSRTLLHSFRTSLAALERRAAGLSLNQ